MNRDEITDKPHLILKIRFNWKIHLFRLLFAEFLLLLCNIASNIFDDNTADKKTPDLLWNFLGLSYFFRAIWEVVFIKILQLIISLLKFWFLIIWYFTNAITHFRLFLCIKCKLDMHASPMKKKVWLWGYINQEQTKLMVLTKTNVERRSFPLVWIGFSH